MQGHLREALKLLVQPKKSDSSTRFLLGPAQVGLQGSETPREKGGPVPPLVVHRRKRSRSGVQDYSDWG